MGGWSFEGTSQYRTFRYFVEAYIGLSQISMTKCFWENS